MRPHQGARPPQEGGLTMARVKNVSGVDRIVAGRLVLAGAVLEVPDEDVESYTCQEINWQSVKPSKDNSNTPQEG
jgi:hypothetical protein